MKTLVRLLAAAALFFAGVSAHAANDAVLLLSSRGGWVEAIDPATLETVARIRTPKNTESVASDSTGARLFVAAPKNPPNACCSLFALDPASMQLTPFASGQSVTVAGGKLLVAKSNRVLGVFDAETLKPSPALPAAGFYRLRASPDGHAVFGIATFPEPIFDFFDMNRDELVVSHVLTQGARMAGAFVGDRYYLMEFAPATSSARLHWVRSDTGQFSEAVELRPENAPFPVCAETPYDVAVSDGKLAVYAQFGYKSAGGCSGPRGYVTVDTASGVVSDRLAPTHTFRQIVSGFGDGALYGIDTGASTGWGQASLVKIDAATGKTLRERKLDDTVWYLAAGHIPAQLKGKLDLTALMLP